MRDAQLIRRLLGTGTLQEADLVLGGDDGKDCTYAGGYLKRQAVFSCLTCVPDGVAGVCTACSLACHDGHEVTHLNPLFFQSSTIGSDWLPALVCPCLVACRGSLSNSNQDLT